MRIIHFFLIGLLALSVSSCRLLGKKDEPAAQSLETQLTPVKPETEATPEPETPPAN